ncbi:hypothetical protein HYX12_04705 [Candidatus Woesearchaeota archaeon]|nr:hypothetical protein [Candidatus Woesearchaeota archaeon]
MKIKEIRDIVLIVGVLVYVLTFSFISLVPTLFPNWYYEMVSFSQNPLQISPQCVSAQDETHSLRVTVWNYGLEDVEDLACRVTDTSGLTLTSEESQTIGALGTQSSDICMFDLTGTYKKPIRVVVTYGDKVMKQAVDCYPSGY